jgi:hypothetical protein
MVTIKVPSDTSMGERYGVIWAQEESAVQRPGHFEITELNRVGVRVYLASPARWTRSSARTPPPGTGG